MRAFRRHSGYEVDETRDWGLLCSRPAAGAVSAVQEAMTALQGGPIAIAGDNATLGEAGLDPPGCGRPDVHTAAR